MCYHSQTVLWDSILLTCKVLQILLHPTLCCIEQHHPCFIILPQAKLKPRKTPQCSLNHKDTLSTSQSGSREALFTSQVQVQCLALAFQIHSGARPGHTLFPHRSSFCLEDEGVRTCQCTTVSMDEPWMESAFLHPSSLPLDNGMDDLSCSSLEYPAIQRSALDKTPNTSPQAPLPAPLCTNTSSFQPPDSGWCRERIQQQRLWDWMLTSKLCKKKAKRFQKHP